MSPFVARVMVNAGSGAVPARHALAAAGGGAAAGAGVPRHEGAVNATTAMARTPTPAIPATTRLGWSSQLVGGSGVGGWSRSTSTSVMMATVRLLSASWWGVAESRQL